ncbi:MAG: signal peptidase I [Firmicutes bacterium]|nr:signal peptidase I [Bacillota bacterium]
MRISIKSRNPNMPEEAPVTKETLGHQKYSVEELETELKREERKSQYKATTKSTISVLIVVTALSILVATLWMPVLRVYGTSMTPTLMEGEIVISIKGSDYKVGDIISFYYENKLLVKRYIAGPGDWVDIDESGNVYVNGEMIDEPYIDEKAYGDVTIKLPYQVPEGRFFVLGDHRATSADSRLAVIGCVAEEQIVGKIVYKVFPFSDFGSI